MRLASKVVTWVVGVFTLANTWGPSPIGSVLAQEESKPANSARGGALAKVGAYQFEVFFYTKGLRVFLQYAAGAPIDASKLTGTVTFYDPSSPEPWFARPLRPAARPDTGHASESLDLFIDLRTVPPSGAKVTFEVSGLRDSAQSTARFTVPVEFVKTPSETRAVDRTPHDRTATDQCS